MAGELDPLLEALRDAGEPSASDVRLATVTDAASGSSGYLVRFDGEGSASSRRYRSLSGVNVNDRVAMIRAGSTWVIVGKIGAGYHPGNAEWGVLGSQSIANGAWATVASWTGQGYVGSASAGIQWIGNGFWQINNPGWYDVKFGFGYGAGSAGGARFGAIALDGSRVVSQGFNAVINHHAGGFLAWEGRINAGQTVSFQTYQDSGATHTLTGPADVGHRTWYAIRRHAD